MLLDKAQQIKAQLRFFEGRTVAGRIIWKIMLCPRSQTVETVVEHCKKEFDYDDILSALNYRDDIDVYIVYRDGESFSSESYDQFAGVHTPSP